MSNEARLSWGGGYDQSTGWWYWDCWDRRHTYSASSYCSMNLEFGQKIGRYLARSRGQIERLNPHFSQLILQFYKWTLNISRILTLFIMLWWVWQMILISGGWRRARKWWNGCTGSSWTDHKNSILGCQLWSICWCCSCFHSSPVSHFHKTEEKMITYLWRQVLISVQASAYLCRQVLVSPEQCSWDVCQSTPSTWHSSG